MDAIVASAMLAKANDKQRLNDQMDALIAESATSRHLTVQQQMLLKRGEITKRSSFEAVPITHPRERMTSAGMAPSPGVAYRGDMYRHPEPFEDGLFSFKCFRACT